MGQTGIYQLPWPDLGSTADGPAAVQALATATESAIARTRGWFSQRTQNDDVGASQWGTITTLTIPDAPAGSYLITSTLYWWAGHQLMESIYCWHGIDISGTPVTAMTTGSVSGPPDRPACAVMQWLHNRATSGGSLTITGRFGFSVQGIRTYAGSSLSVLRVDDA